MKYLNVFFACFCACIDCFRCWSIKPDPTKPGHTFGGWYADEELTTAFNFATAITGDTTLYAKWTANSYTVSFNVDGGTAVVNQTVSYGSTASEPTPDPTKPGHTFGG